MAKKFNVVFNGKMEPNQDIEDVKQRLAAILKLDVQRITRLFDGSPVTIKKNVDVAIAEKYSRAFKGASAICIIEPFGAVPQPLASPKAAAGNGPQTTSSPSGGAPHATFQKSFYGGKMIITNIETIPGRTISEHFGLVSGSTIRAKHVGRDIMASLKNLVGGELKGYTQLLQESRKQAMDRMIAQAKQLGANAIVNVRFSTSSVAQGAAELYAYGTAVKIQ
jgi:uncharacterized protein YbjQ (UPF0145 family)